MKVLIFTALLAAALAGPVREKRSKNAADVLEVIKTLKDPQTYSDLSEISEIFKSMTLVGSEMTAEQRKDMDEGIKLISRVHEGAKILYELAKATLVEGAKPGQDQLVSLAKRLSSVVRQSRLSVRNYATEDTLMTNETIAVLEEISATNPIKESGNNFLDIFKEKLPKVYPAADVLKKIHTAIKVGMKTGDVLGSLKRIPKSEREVLKKLLGEHFADELVAMLKSEEAAVEIVKNYGVVVDTLKTPASYESLQALFNSLSKSKRLEAHGILIREAGKCMGKALDEQEKAEFHEHIGKLLNVVKLFLADGQDTSNIEEIASEFKKKSGPILAKIMMKLSLAIKTPQGKQRLKECLVSEEDRKVYRETQALPDAEFSDSQLTALRQKNEKIYALAYLLNGVVHVVRNREGLGAEADAFLKEMVTMPNSMLRISEFFASQETLDKIAVNKKQVIDKYNGLSAEAKKEFVHVFPYRAVFNLAILD